MATPYLMGYVLHLVIETAVYGMAIVRGGSMAQPQYLLWDHRERKRSDLFAVLNARHPEINSFMPAIWCKLVITQ